MESTPTRVYYAAVTSIAASAQAGGVQLLAANQARLGMYVFNDSTAALYLAYAQTATASAYTVQISPGGFFEMPPNPVYIGVIFGIWAAANGSARITEVS